MPSQVETSNPSANTQTVVLTILDGSTRAFLDYNILNFGDVDADIETWISSATTPLDQHRIDKDTLKPGGRLTTTCALLGVGDKLFVRFSTGAVAIRATSLEETAN